jgi:autotransporter family porin
MKRTATASHPLTPRPLFRSLLLALASLPSGVALAGDLDGQTAEVGAGDPVEAWTLKNGSLLTVNGGAAQTILADDSTVVLSTVVARKPSGDYSGHGPGGSMDAAFNGGVHLSTSITAG